MNLEFTLTPAHIITAGVILYLAIGLIVGRIAAKMAYYSEFKTVFIQYEFPPSAKIRNKHKEAKSLAGVEAVITFLFWPIATLVIVPKLVCLRGLGKGIEEDLDKEINKTNERDK